jgi:hypothetical protein
MYVDNIKESQGNTNLEKQNETENFFCNPIMKKCSIHFLLAMRIINAWNLGCILYYLKSFSSFTSLFLTFIPSFCILVSRKPYETEYKFSGTLSIIGNYLGLMQKTIQFIFINICSLWGVGNNKRREDKVIVRVNRTRIIE